jgi:Ca2+-binding RTX toxin-like protein
MASVSFTFNGDYDPDNTVVLGQDPFTSFYNGTQSPHFLGGYAGFIFFIFNNTGSENDISPSFTDPANPGDARLTTQQYSVSADFSDNIAFVKLSGGDFGDVLRAGSGDDTLSGGGGDDILEGGLGFNQINGGTGINTVSYEHYQDSDSGQGVYVNLDQGFGVSLLVGRLGDQLSNIQNIHGSALFDQLLGNGLDNVIKGGGGADVLYGFGGNDRLILKGSSGATAHGGDDYDILILESGAGPYTFLANQITDIEQVNLRDGVSADLNQLNSNARPVPIGQPRGRRRVAHDDRPGRQDPGRPRGGHDLGRRRQ